MIRASKITVSTFALALLFCLRGDILACTCMGNVGPPCRDYWRADAVFVGQVKAIEFKEQFKKAEVRAPGEEVRVTFTITEAFRGALGKEADVFTNSSGAFCGYSFDSGGTYIVYASEYPKGGGKLYTSICTRTRRYSESSPDIAYAKPLANVPSGAAISGVVIRVREGQGTDSRVPLANVRVIVTGRDKQVKVTANNKGRYKTPPLPAGEYAIKIEPPEGMSERKWKATVTDRGCVEVSFQPR